MLVLAVMPNKLRILVWPISICFCLITWHCYLSISLDSQLSQCAEHHMGKLLMLSVWREKVFALAKPSPSPIASFSVTSLQAKELLLIQVRIYGPRLGVVKGMLRRKPGIQRIQLPPSMMKVPPSAVSDEDWAVIVVTAMEERLFKGTTEGYVHPYVS